MKTALVVSLMALLVMSCAQDAERVLLSQFFAASRLRDLTALRKFSTVVFEPREQGMVLGFDITRIQRHGETEDVYVSARVRTPAGDVARQNLRVTIAGGRVTSVTTDP